MEIHPQDSGKKLHRYLRQALPGMPLSGIYKMIRVGRVKVNGKKGKMETVLAPGDALAIYVHEQEFPTLAKAKPKFSGMSDEIDVIFEDDHLLVVNKPVGLLTHPDSAEHKDTLINRALAYLYRNGEIADSRSFLPATVNRLDRNTSGLVLIGKDGDTLRMLSESIRERRVEKQYLGIVWGRVAQDGHIDAPLVRDPAGGRTSIAESDDEGAQDASTRYRVLGSAAGFSLLMIDLLSGRTHQIRAHLQSIRHPLLGDVKYGGKVAFDVQHHLLHAARIALADGREFVAPVSSVMDTVLRQTGLVRFAGSYAPRPTTTSPRDRGR